MGKSVEMKEVSIYKQIKGQVSTRAVAEHYGYKVSRSGMMCCPFHDDRNPSMKVDENFICFGCQEKGDVITFVSKLFGLSPYGAAMKIVSDMGLSVEGKRRMTALPGTVRRAKREQETKRKMEQAVKRIYKVYSDYLALLNVWAEVYAPKKPGDHPAFLFEKAMSERTYVEDLLDCLLSDSEEDKAWIVLQKGKEVADLERQIREYKSGDGERFGGSSESGTAGNDRGRSEQASGIERQETGKKLCGKRREDPVL